MTDFGLDLDCADDLSADMRTVSGVAGVAQAIYRRLTTPRGMVLDALDYGYDVRSLLHKGQTPIQKAAIPGLIRSEILKDDRIASVEVEVTTFTNDTIGLAIRCETAEGPFELVLDISAAIAKLVEVR